MTVRWKPNALVLSLSASTEASAAGGGERAAAPRVDGLFDDPNWSVKASAGLDWARLRSDRMSLGTRAGLGYRRMDVVRTLVGPAGEELDTMPVGDSAWFAEVWPLELTLDRRSRWWPTIGPGVRFVFGAQRAIAPMAHLRTSAFSLVPRVALTAELAAGWEFTRELESRYGLVGGAASPETSRAFVFGVSVGIDWVPPL
jgi:hypothetical protein